MWKKKLFISVSVFTLILSSIPVSAAELSSNHVQSETSCTENGRNLNNSLSQDDSQQDLELDSVMPRVAGTWINEGGRWWFKYPNGSYPRNQWEEVNGLWYHFDSSGWMETEKWIQDGGKWYYVNASGVMVVENWMLLGGKWYYFDAHGAMVIGWRILGGKWYYFDTNGAMLSNTTRIINGNTYKFAGDGKLYYTVLGVKRVTQREENWCWAAVSQMVGTFGTSSTINQTDIVIKIKGGTQNVIGATAVQIVQAIEYASENTKSATSYLDARSFPEFVRQIDSNSPFAIGMTWFSEGGHAITGAGYNINDSSIYVIDPGPGVSSAFYNYDLMKKGTQIGSGNGYIYQSITTS